MKPVLVIWMVVTLLSCSALGAGSGVVIRTLSLDDCIREALTNNFDVQVARFTSQLSAYSLAAAYGGYDPLLNISGQHNYSVTPSSLTQDQLQYPSSVANVDSFNSGLSGLLPWGFQYNLAGNISQNNGYFTGTNANNYRDASGSVGLTMTQPLLKNFWIDSTRLQIRAARNSLKYSEQGLRAQLITSVVEIQTAYYELIYARENVQVQKDALTLAQTQLEQDQQRQQIGTLAQLSVEQDESQMAQSQANLITAQSTLETDENNLKNLITDDYKDWQAVKLLPAEPLAAQKQYFDLQDSWNKGMTLRPDYLQAQITLEQQGIQLKFDRNQLFPQLNLTGSFGYNGAGAVYNDVFAQYQNQNSPFYSYGAQLSMPLANTQARNSYKADKVTERQDLLKLKQLEQDILVEIDNAVKQAESDYESVQATRQARIYAEAALDAEEKTYAVGNATTFEVLTYQSNLTTARGQEIRSLANYEEALATLAQQEGSTLQQRNIDVIVQ